MSLVQVQSEPPKNPPEGVFFVVSGASQGAILIFAKNTALWLLACYNEFENHFQIREFMQGRNNYQTKQKQEIRATIRRRRKSFTIGDLKKSFDFDRFKVNLDGRIGYGAGAGVEGGVQYSDGKLGINSSLQRPKLGLSGSAGVDVESNGINTKLLEIDKNLNHDDKNKTKK